MMKYRKLFLTCKNHVKAFEDENDRINDERKQVLKMNNCKT